MHTPSQGLPILMFVWSIFNCNGHTRKKKCLYYPDLDGAPERRAGCHNILCPFLFVFLNLQTTAETTVDVFNLIREQA